MNPHLITEPDLMSWLNCTRRADLERHLRVNGVTVIYGVGGSICTTIEAVNAALGVSKQPASVLSSREVELGES
ncbi:MAG: hypothetical protein KDI55_02290 [Anaerolineae bacterium]|nr:hypothetical protein [Anaerolineae bacterium]MCP5428566.1 hypothetical protein [Chromatiaceae bacterium]